jgi:hypothetical protein
MLFMIKFLRINMLIHHLRSPSRKHDNSEAKRQALLLYEVTNFDICRIKFRVRRDFRHLRIPSAQRPLSGSYHNETTVDLARMRGLVAAGLIQHHGALPGSYLAQACRCVVCASPVVSHVHGALRRGVSLLARTGLASGEFDEEHDPTATRPSSSCRPVPN